MSTHKFPVGILLILIGIASNANAVSFDVSVDTTPLAGVPGYIAFDFIDGDGLVNNQTGISGFSTDAVLGALSLTGDARGDLIPGPLVLGDNDFFNEGLQQVTYGTSIEYRLALTNAGPYQPIPDAFAFFLLDEFFVPFPTDDPLFADALIIADIASADPVPVVFGSAFATATVAPVNDGGTIAEPMTAALLSLGLAGVGYQRRKRTTAT